MVMIESKKHDSDYSLGRGILALITVLKDMKSHYVMLIYYASCERKRGHLASTESRRPAADRSSGSCTAAPRGVFVATIWSGIWSFYPDAGLANLQLECVLVGTEHLRRGPSVG